MKFFLLVICTLIFSRGALATPSMEELQNLQAAYLSKNVSRLSFVQKSLFEDFGEPMEAGGFAVIDRKQKTFSWKITRPSDFAFSVKKGAVHMQVMDAKEQIFPLESLPSKFKFVQVFFEILGFKKISEKSWKVEKIGKRKFKLQPLSTQMPISNLQILFLKSGAPGKVNFSNAAKTKFEITFKEEGLLNK